MISWLDASLVRLLGAALTSVCLGALLVGPVALLMRVLPGTNGATRHAVWWAVLSVMVLMPWAVTLLPRPAPESTAVVLHGGARTGSGRSASEGAPAALHLRPPAVIVRGAGLAWLLGSLGLMAGIGRGLWRVRRLKRSAVALPGDREERLRLLGVLGRSGRPVRVAVTPWVRSPVAVGYLRPAVLLPDAMAVELGDEDLALVVGHELAHLVRRDDWTDLLQRLLGALLFFHPPVGWVRRQIRLEMEKACDHWVVATSGCTGERYARCLVRVAQGALDGRRVPLPAATGRLRHRVATLLDHPLPLRATISPGPAVVLGAGLAILTLVASWLPAPVLSAGTGASVEVAFHEPEVARLVAELSHAGPVRRAEAAYALGQMRGRAASASPRLAELLHDRAEVPRRPGRTSRVWGRPDERPDVTSVGEEALKALLYIGREASLEPLSRAVADGQWPDEHLARWGLRLLREFDGPPTP